MQMCRWFGVVKEWPLCSGGFRCRGNGHQHDEPAVAHMAWFSGKPRSGSLVIPTPTPKMFEWKESKLLDHTEVYSTKAKMEVPMWLLTGMNHLKAYAG